MRRLFLILGALVMTMGFVRPSPNPVTKTEHPEGAAGEAAGTVRSGLRVFVDPQTGELVSEPTQEQLRRLRLERRASEVERRSSWDLHEFRLRNGGRGVFLDGWADHELAVQRAADGSLHAVCSQGGTHEHPESPPTLEEK